VTGVISPVELRYVLNEASDEPIMLIEGRIGLDENGQGVDGGRFCRELLFLDTLNKSKINVWINSPGGSIVDSDLIIASILKSKTKVDTHNVGIVASCATAIFLAGRNRYMMDYGKCMIHGVSGVSGEELKVFEDGIRTNLTSRCGLTDEQARQMMSRDTWINASDIEKYGIAKIESSGSFNKPYGSPANQATWEDFKSVVNELKSVHVTTKENTMKNVTSMLNLNEAANEAAIVTEIQKVQNSYRDAEARMVKQEAENKVKFDAINEKLVAAEKAKTEAENKLAEIEKAGNEAKVTALKTTAEAAVNEAVKGNKIENKAEVIAEWVKNYIANPTGTAALIAVIPVNRKGPGAITGAGKTGGEKVPQYTAAGVMAEINAKNQRKTN
jgi:ATP-dependent protease ClpP protease subunit